MSLHLAKKHTNRSVVYTRTELARLLKVTDGFIESVAGDPCAFYRSFSIPKRNGKPRPIDAPKDRLKTLQRRALAICYHRLRIPTYLHGGLPGRSTISHAKPHIAKKLVVTLDIRVFYPSTTPDIIEPVLYQAGFSGQALVDLITLVTLNGHLPQGSPASCFLANMGLVVLERPVWRKCRSEKLNFTRFIDDIAISGDWDFQNLISWMIAKIEAQSYKIAPEKVSIMEQGQRQIVTGLVVNHKLRPTKPFVADLKHDIRLCLEHGPMKVAQVQGISVAKLKKRLNGRNAHLRQFDEKKAKHFSCLMYGVNWRSCVDTPYPKDIDHVNRQFALCATPSRF